MTYFEILLVFILPPILVLAFRLRKKIAWKEIRLLLILVVVAVTYTTPWDNYLVANSIWWYDPDLVTGITLGWVPIEEYTFFVLQTLLTGQFYLLVKKQDKTNISYRHNKLRWAASGLVLVIWLAAASLFFSGEPSWTYLSITVAWAFIPILIQVGFGADLLLRDWKNVGLAILLPTVYLCAVDWMALGFGTWTISPLHTTGLSFGDRLPIEEATFFLLTNVLVVFGLHLGLHPSSLKRLPKRIRNYF